MRFLQIVSYATVALALPNPVLLDESATLDKRTSSLSDTIASLIGNIRSIKDSHQGGAQNGSKPAKGSNGAANNHNNGNTTFGDGHHGNHTFGNDNHGNHTPGDHNHEKIGKVAPQPGQQVYGMLAPGWRKRGRNMGQGFEAEDLILNTSVTCVSPAQDHVVREAWGLASLVETDDLDYQS
ncbi:hypothetical protein AB5N19_07026 [Seiridium cardinale]